MKTTKKQNVWNVIVNTLKTLWGYVTKPFKSKVEVKPNEVDKHFSKDFQKEANDIKKLMNLTKKDVTDRDYLNNKLVEARKHINENNITLGAQMTDVDTMNEHNQNGGYTNKTLSEVIKHDADLTRKSLDGTLSNRLKHKAKVRWVSRS